MPTVIALATASRSHGPLGGIGIRSGFKIRDPKGCPGSSPGGATQNRREKTALDSSWGMLCFLGLHLDS